MRDCAEIPQIPWWSIQIQSKSQLVRKIKTTFFNSPLLLMWPNTFLKTTNSQLVLDLLGIQEITVKSQKHPLTYNSIKGNLYINSFTHLQIFILPRRGVKLCNYNCLVVKLNSKKINLKSFRINSRKIRFLKMGIKL